MLIHRVALGRVCMGHSLRSYQVRTTYNTFTVNTHDCVRSIGPAFSDVHNFNIGQTGTVFVTMM